MRRVIRGIIDSVIEGAIKRISLKGVAGEQLTDRELFQHYGFTSRPVAGAEAIVIREGNCFYVIAEDDRRYRLQIGAGEVALYDSQGQKVHLKDGKQIEISGCDQLTAIVAVQADIACPVVNATGDLNVGGNLTVGGNAAVTGIATAGSLAALTTCADATGTMQQMRDVFNQHNHPGDSGGATGVPNSQM